MRIKEPLSEELGKKLHKLEEGLRELGSAAVCFSGGVDSALLLEAAHEALGERTLAVTAAASFMPEREFDEARAFCEERQIRQIIFRVDPMQEESFRFNHPDRCYHCKRLILTEAKRLAEENGMIWLAEGSNTDDLLDYRPGARAVSELGVRSPLREAGLSKNEIRQISKACGLPTWNKPAYACLASRFAPQEEITEEKLRRVELAEQFLIEHGFREERVRLHGNLARIEVPEADISRIADDNMRVSILNRLKELGFSFVTLDLGGYRMGSMNAPGSEDPSLNGGKCE